MAVNQKWLSTRHGTEELLGKDSNGNPFIASSCQGLGASVWWPNKDHMYDEVESMLISVNVPGNLINVSNGRLISVKKLKDGTKHLTGMFRTPSIMASI
jgi:aminopeptidase N